MVMNPNYINSHISSLVPLALPPISPKRRGKKKKLNHRQPVKDSFRRIIKPQGNGTEKSRYIMSSAIYNVDNLERRPKDIIHHKFTD